MNKDFKRRMQEELCCYDTSFRAFLLGYDSWYIGTYIRCKRITSYYCGKSLIYKMIMGVADKKSRTKVGFSVWYGIHWFRHQDIPLGEYRN